MGDEVAKQKSTSGSRPRFFGQFPVRLDNAMRLALPAAHREVLETHYGHDGLRLILLPGVDCIRVMPPDVWEKVEQVLQQVSRRFNRNTDQLLTYFYALMAECELDAQNRIRLTPSLCRHIGLERDAVVTGANNEMRIWRQYTWEKFCQDMSHKFADELDALDQALRDLEQGRATQQNNQGVPGGNPISRE